MVNQIIPYVPKNLIKPGYLVDVETAWDGVELILWDVIRRWDIFPGTALEFGVGYGYSTAALANYFNQVIGVDHFQGDVNAGYPKGQYEKAQKALKDFKNILLLQSDYQTYMSGDVGMVDLIHIDIDHGYESTNKLGAWAIEHSDVVMFHDTISFPEVKRAVEDLAWESGRTFYEYVEKHGVGFLVKE